MIEDKIKKIVNLLCDEITIIEDKNNFLINSYFYTDIYKQLFTYLDIDNTSILLDNRLYIESILSILYTQKKARNIYNKIYYLSSKISMYQNLEYYENDQNYIKIFKELKDLTNQLKEDYDLLNGKKLYYEKSLVERQTKNTDYNRILFSLKNNIPLTDNDLIIIYNLLKENILDELEIKIYLEYLDMYKNTLSKVEIKSNKTIIDLLKKEFKIIEVNNFISNDDKIRLHNFITSLSTALIDDNIENVVYIIKELTIEEKEYVLLNILNRYITLLNSCRNNLLNDDSYFDKELKQVILMEYEEYLRKYNSVLEYYNSLTKDNETIKKPDNNVKRNIYFALSSSGPFIEKDLEDISSHYYDIIIDTLEKYKNGTLSVNDIERFTRTNDHLKSYFKLKVRHIRIICKPLKDNKTLILGALDKQDNKGTKRYERLVMRDRNNCYIDNDEINEQWYDYLISKMKKGRRKGE